MNHQPSPCPGHSWIYIYSGFLFVVFNRFFYAYPFTPFRFKCLLSLYMSRLHVNEIKKESKLDSGTCLCDSNRSGMRLRVLSLTNTNIPMTNTSNWTRTLMKRDVQVLATQYGLRARDQHNRLRVIDNHSRALDRVADVQLV